MFKFSFNRIKDLCSGNLSSSELLEILNLQGFEVKSVQEIGDDTEITIEVKANRPDMLSHLGISREVCAFRNQTIPSVEKCNIIPQNDKFALKINIDGEKICSRFSGVILRNIDNTGKTPLHITKTLETLGINLVNPVVDIANYIMFEFGQPMHTYDLDKIFENELIIKKAPDNCTVDVLGNKSANVRKNDIIISDKDKILCIAGIVGSENSSVKENTKNIFIESAVFDEVSIRLASKAMKLSTPSSFRFERGVNLEISLDVLQACSEMILKYCGGKADSAWFDKQILNQDVKTIDLRVKRANEILGIDLSVDSMIQYLERYGFPCIKNSDGIINVKIPGYRLDVCMEIDLVEEIARIHGYDNIDPVMPMSRIQYNDNPVWSCMDMLRNILTGAGFCEVVNYSFIPHNSMEVLNIKKDSPIYSDLLLQNPIARAYSLMRPTLAYSLLSSLAYNYSRNNTDLALFEIGRVYFKDTHYDTGCRETDLIGFIISGSRIEKGFGIQDDIKYSYYDLLNYLNIIFRRLGKEFSLNPNEYGFCEDGTSYDIICDNIRIGFIGEINRKKLSVVPNVKLLKDKIFYCEMNVENLNEQHKVLKFESRYPKIKRLYNFIVSKDIPAGEVINIISGANSIIKNILVKDIYEDKKMISLNQRAILFEVSYCSSSSTLTSEQIQKIESKFIKELKSKTGSFLKL